MDITLDLSLLIGLVSIPIVVPLLVQHAKRLERYVRGDPQGSPYPAIAVVVALVWVHGLDQAGVLQDELGADSLNAWAVTLVGLAVGAIAPLGYDGWRRLRPGGTQPQR